MTANRFFYSLDEQGMNLTIREQPIFEDESQAKQAMDDMANTLRMVSDVQRDTCALKLLTFCSELRNRESDAMQAPFAAVGTCETRSSFRIPLPWATKPVFL